ncbi:MAG: hypothetical protein Q4D39_07835 [Coriobacteriaceae bacterium]|nr:hypothetical protein [Coriobacteriaceae bacterium]
MKKKELVELAMETAHAFEHRVSATVRKPKGCKSAPSDKEVRAFMDGVSGACDMLSACSIMPEGPSLDERVSALFAEWLDVREEREHGR